MLFFTIWNVLLECAMKKRVFYWLVSGVILLVLGGCLSVGPDYKRPETVMPDAWHSKIQDELSSETPDIQKWWTVFEDDILNELIAQATTNNLDLKTAAARIEQAAALRGVSASQYFPEIFANGGASAVQRTDRNTPPGTDRRGALYSAGLSMAWELDLWGRVRRSVESADASWMATVEDYRDVMVVLYADIALNYIKVRTLQERIHFAENNLAAQKKTKALSKNRFDSGLVPMLDVSQAQLNYSRTASLIPPLKQQLIVTINRLSVLTGQMPYALYKKLEKVQPIPVPPAKLVLGLPSELLRQRPDIRRAERNLAAQNALIGATKAELYPTLALPGTLALEAPNGDLFKGSNLAYSFGPQVRWSIFDGGRIRSQVHAEEAATRAALHIYEQTVLKALEETEDSMAAFANEKDRIKSLETASTSARKSVDLVMELYKSGLTDFQNVLNMELALLTQEDQLASSRGLISIDLVRIYKALGGGWTIPKEQGNE
jgi:NodT family efflux transporter outer membrane factor (OMF) lipoprotein